MLPTYGMDIVHMCRVLRFCGQKVKGFDILTTISKRTCEPIYMWPTLLKGRGGINEPCQPVEIANQILCHCCFTCLLLRSICGTRNSSRQTSLQCLSTINMAFSDEDKILIKTHKYPQHTQLRPQRN